MQFLARFLFLLVIGQSLAVLNNSPQDLSPKPYSYNEPATQYLPADINAHTNIQRPIEDSTVQPGLYKYPKPKILTPISYKPLDPAYKEQAAQGAYHYNGVVPQNELSFKKDYNGVLPHSDKKEYSSGSYYYNGAVQENSPATNAQGPYEYNRIPTSNNPSASMENIPISSQNTPQPNKGFYQYEAPSQHQDALPTKPTYPNNQQNQDVTHFHYLQNGENAYHYTLPGEKDSYQFQKPFLHNIQQSQQDSSAEKPTVSKEHNGATVQDPSVYNNKVPYQYATPTKDSSAVQATMSNQHNGAKPQFSSSHNNAGPYQYTTPTKDSSAVNPAFSNHHTDQINGVIPQYSPTKGPYHYSPPSKDNGVTPQYPATFNNEGPYQYSPPSKDNGPWTPIAIKNDATQQNPSTTKSETKGSSGPYQYNRPEQYIPSPPSSEQNPLNQALPNLSAINKHDPQRDFNQQHNLSADNNPTTDSIQPADYHYNKQSVETSSNSVDNLSVSAHSPSFQTSPTKASHYQQQNPTQYTTPSKLYQPPIYEATTTSTTSTTNSPQFQQAPYQYRPSIEYQTQSSQIKQQLNSSPLPPTSTSSYHGPDYQYLPATTIKPNSNNPSNPALNSTSSSNKGPVALNEGYRYNTPALKEPSAHKENFNGINYNELGMGMNVTSNIEHKPKDHQRPDFAKTEVESNQGYIYGKPQGNRLDINKDGYNKDGITHLIPVPTMPSSYIYYRPHKKFETSENSKGKQHNQQQIRNETLEDNRPSSQNNAGYSKGPLYTPSLQENSLNTQQASSPPSLPQTWGNVGSYTYNPPNHQSSLPHRTEKPTMKPLQQLVAPSYQGTDVRPSPQVTNNVNTNGYNYHTNSEKDALQTALSPNIASSSSSFKQDKPSSSSSTSTLNHNGNIAQNANNHQNELFNPHKFTGYPAHESDSYNNRPYIVDNNNIRRPESQHASPTSSSAESANYAIPTQKEPQRSNPLHSTLLPSNNNPGNMQQQNIQTFDLKNQLQTSPMNQQGSSTYPLENNSQFKPSLQYISNNIPTSSPANDPVYTQSQLSQIAHPQNSQFSIQTLLNQPKTDFQPPSQSLSPSHTKNLKPGYQYFHQQLPLTENQRQKTQNPKVISDTTKQYHSLQTQQTFPPTYSIPGTNSAGNFIGTFGHISSTAATSTNNGGNSNSIQPTKPSHKPMIFEDTKTYLQMPSQSFELPSYYTIVPNHQLQGHYIKKQSSAVQENHPLSNPSIMVTTQNPLLFTQTPQAHAPISLKKPMVFVETPIVPLQPTRQPHMLYGAPLLKASNIFLPPPGGDMRNR
ncbi:GATA zinc finger domain-containing protein 14-like [Stomoxys calcitrans]|uniref:GATA zinc finger domain-containing protein 14-like n=1 Tax=Stomoxys calcitrans TaxID=35570 RepID=UPI0027E34099|nr:GATA zinc finger domain-containing protein 14-like [Stomoxys calcitrans]